MKNLPKTFTELKSLSFKERSELWSKFVSVPYKSQVRSLWWYVSSSDQRLKIAPKHLVKIKKYAQNPEECLFRMNKMKYQLHPGSEIIKVFRGVEFKIDVIALDVFEFRGKRYRSLSAVAKEICGRNVSGPDFFGLNNKGVMENADG